MSYHIAFLLITGLIIESANLLNIDGGYNQPWQKGPGSLWGHAIQI